jgi:hypothetical protein
MKCSESFPSFSLISHGLLTVDSYPPNRVGTYLFEIFEQDSSSRVAGQRLICTSAAMMPQRAWRCTEHDACTKRQPSDVRLSLAYEIPFWTIKEACSA